ncbi:MAG: filamentous hemagglutinin N-terminal domain-containing protein [Pseudomonadota bacterium]|nr:filamentous hemagglutinin N-terminal domain-containing protein [Pseudomonadota bacterium]
MSRFRPVPVPALTLLLAALPPCAWSGPTGGNVVSGAADITYGATSTSVDQSSQHTAIDWTSFNIGAGESVTFNQPNADSIALNRDFSGSASQLFGSLNANGNVFLVNSAGVLVGAGASINVGGLLLTDLAVTDEDAAAFATNAAASGWSLALSDQDLAAGGIEILGSVYSSGANGITLAGQYLYIEGEVISTGVADDPGGNLQLLAAGSTVLVADASGLLGMEITGPVAQLLPGRESLFEIPDTVTGTAVQAVNGGVTLEVAYEENAPVAASPWAPGINFPGTAVSSIGDGSYITYSARAFPRTVTLSREDADALENIVDEAQDPKTEGTGAVSDNQITPTVTVDQLLGNCEPQAEQDADCRRQNAIKRYLGRLLIGGGLP